MAPELYEAYQAIGLTTEEFEGPRYQRIAPHPAAPRPRVLDERLRVTADEPTAGRRGRRPSGHGGLEDVTLEGAVEGPDRAQPSIDCHADPEPSRTARARARSALEPPRPWPGRSR